MKLLLFGQERPRLLLIVGICYQLQEKPKRNFRIPFCVLFPFRLYSEHMDLCL